MRKAQQHHLRPLAEVFQEFPPIERSDNVSQKVHEYLHAAVLRLQHHKERPFYTMREVADFFPVPLKSVHRAYKKLSEQGLIRVVRGCGTFICGLDTTAREHIRGMVCIPIWLPGFLISPPGRVLCSRLEYHLRKRGYASSLLFYEDREEGGTDLAGRILDHKPDLVYWHAPPGRVRNSIASIRDRGIPVIVLSDGKAFADEAHYSLDIEVGYRQAFENWKKTGIEEAIVVHSGGFLDASAYRAALQAAQKISMPLRSICSNFNDYPEELRKPLPPRAGIIFPVSQHYSGLTLQHAKEVIDLTRRHRILWGNDAVTHPLFDQERPVVDLLRHDFECMASRIASDIFSRKHHNPDFRHRFTSDFVPQFQLGGADHVRYFVASY